MVITQKKVKETKDVNKIIEEKYNKVYKNDIKRLADFQYKWETYYAAIVKKYPLDAALLSAKEFSNNLKLILKNKGYVTNGEFKINVDGVDFKIDAKQSAGENLQGFNIDDVINPKEKLNLEELCKELGLIK